MMNRTIGGLAFVMAMTGFVLVPDGAGAQRRFDDRDEPPRLRSVLPPRVVPRHHHFHHVGPRPLPPARGVIVVAPPIGYAPIYVPPPPPVPPTPGGSISIGSPEIIEFPEGRYELRGDGITTPYRWVWIPKAPTAPPPSASEPPSPTTLYRWTDDNGAVHWTDRWEAVPERYREKATKVPS